MLNKWFSKIDKVDEAKKATTQGAVGVLLFAAMNSLGALIAYYASRSPVDGSAIDAQAVWNQVVGTFVVIPLLLFFAWRIHNGKGWLVAALVLAWFTAEIALKVSGGTTNVGWMLFYVVVWAMIFNGARGCWWMRKGAVDRAPKASESA